MIEHGVEYQLPKVTLMSDTGIGIAEIAARTCYDSFENSENDCIKEFNTLDTMNGTNLDLINEIKHSQLLTDLAWTHFHHSILEHANLAFLIKGTSRGVLQEHARHRIQSISVRSTRYTMSNIINAFVVEVITNPSNTYPSNWFIATLMAFDMFVTTDWDYNVIQITDIFNKLKYQYHKIGHDEFLQKAIAKSSLPILKRKPKLDSYLQEELFRALEAGKKKRNVGDAFKHIVNDNWKVDMVVTFNLRSLKNYLTLRDSGAAYFQIRWLAQAMKDVIPQKYLDLIIKA